MRLTRSALERLKALVLEHPKDPIVRVQVKDLDEQRLSFNITLEDRVQPGDEAQVVDGLTVAIPTASAARMKGITMGFRSRMVSSFTTAINCRNIFSSISLT